LFVKDLSDGRLFVRIDEGEDLIERLTFVLSSKDIWSGMVQGIGALKEAELGFFNVKKGEYIKKTYSGEFELVSCVGNISSYNGKPFPHLHAVISDESFSCCGGHLFRAIINPTSELIITKEEQVLVRKAAGKTLGVLHLGEYS